MSDSEEEIKEKQLKLVFLGEPNVGKTCIIRRFCYDEFTRHYSQTIGAEFYIKRVELPEKEEIVVRMSDVGGMEMEGHMLKNYLFNVNVVILVYDITDCDSFENMALWINKIRADVSDPFIAVFANKCDLEHKRAVRMDKTKKFVEEYVIEKYTENIRFCIICNYMSKIIPALQSRCTRFRFGPLSSEQIMPRLEYVVEQEGVTITEDGKRALLTLANGDMRKVLNVLQSTWLAYKNVTEDNVYTCVGHPLRKDIENIFKWLLNSDFKTTYNNIKELKMIKGLALHDILTEIHDYSHRAEFPFDVLIDLSEKISDIELRLCAGADENIQLTALIAAFQQVKKIVPPE
nr:unnamed protein product [Callosobruchus chinensis]